MSKQTLRIATRKSPLALWQAEYVKAELLTHHPELNIELVTMTTQGDKILDAPLAKIGGKGLFVKELEVAMLEGRADIAVHSMKDVPMELPEELALTTICKRETPFDAFVSNTIKSFSDLPQGAKVGTSSLRRSAQLKAQRPDLDIISLRGNVNTRLAKLDSGDYDAIILAAAGLVRLGFEGRIQEVLPPELSLPAVGQGAVGIECRTNDADTHKLLAPLHHQETAACVEAERAMNLRLKGGCQVPIAGFATLDGNTINMKGLVASTDGKTILSTTLSDDMTQSAPLGTTIAEDLLSQGAEALLAAVYEQQQTS